MDKSSPIITQFEKEMAAMLDQIQSGKPLEMSEETRKLASQVVEQQKNQKPLSQSEIKAWAEKLVASTHTQD